MTAGTGPSDCFVAATERKLSPGAFLAVLVSCKPLPHPSAGGQSARKEMLLAEGKQQVVALVFLERSLPCGLECHCITAALPLQFNGLESLFAIVVRFNCKFWWDFRLSFSIESNQLSFRDEGKVSKSSSFSWIRMNAFISWLKWQYSSSGRLSKLVNIHESVHTKVHPTPFSSSAFYETRPRAFP